MQYVKVSHEILGEPRTAIFFPAKGVERIRPEMRDSYLGKAASSKAPDIHLWEPMKMVDSLPAMA